MDKKDVQDLLKSNKKIEVSSKEKKSIIKAFLKKVETRFIISAIEEINELNQVVIKNVYTSKFDYIHTVEELGDALNVRDFLITYYDIKISDLEKLSKHKVKPLKNIDNGKNLILEEVDYLIDASHILSKILRGKDISRNKILDVINSINIGIYHLINYYNIKRADVIKIRNFKLKRIKERTKLKNPLNA